jgi:hypothetical protein
MITRRVKAIIIVHLCLAFTYLIWSLLQPPLRDHLFKKAELSLYQNIFERKELFDKLEPNRREMIEEGFQKATHQSKRPYLQTLSETFSAISFVWIVFSIAIGLLLLFHIPGAREAAWILPCCVLFHFFLLWKAPVQFPQESLFPSEEYVKRNYLPYPSSERFGDQRKELLEAWHRYLISEWAYENPSLNKEIFQLQVDRGLFAFNIKRIENLQKDPSQHLFTGFIQSKSSFVQLIVYLAWNIFFAWIVKKKQSKSEVASGLN